MNPIKQAGIFYRVMAEWLGVGGRPVEKELAQARAFVCISCPMNKQRGLYEGVATGTALLLLRQLELKNKMQMRVEGEKSLHVCKGCGCVLRLKVHVPIEFIKETTEIDNLHPDCWIRKELQ